MRRIEMATTDLATSRLIATDLTVGYSGVAVVSGVDLALGRGEVVAVIGRNGAGKTTLLHALAGLLPPLSGRILFDGVEPPSSLHQRARRGLGLVTEDRAVVRRLSVADNLRLAGAPADAVFARFPELAPLRSRRAGLLSGGEQQMLALGRVLAKQPTVLLIDELSQGLAPMIVERLLCAVRQAAAEAGAGVLIVEQQAATALRVADRAYVISGGRVVMSGSVAELRDRWEEIEKVYLVG
jgi:branched-chain amino acid transport system ATP-binding protein